jgi:transcriptional regulator with XRE-family HTH domain
MATKTAGERLRAWRVANGYTVQQLADVFGKHKNHVCAMQSGKRKPGRALASRIQEMTGIRIDEWDK